MSAPNAGIDWSKFDAGAEDTCTCRCGARFRSHAKIVMLPVPMLLARKACPGCKRHDDLTRVASDPETVTIRGSGR